MSEAAADVLPESQPAPTKMSIYFILHNRPGAMSDEGTPEGAVEETPLSSLRVLSVELTAEEAGLVHDSLGSCLAIAVELQQGDGEPQVIMLPVRIR